MPLRGLEALEHRVGDEAGRLAVRLLLGQLPLRMRLGADEQQILAVARAAQNVQHRLELGAVRTERAALELAREIEPRGVDGKHDDRPLLAVHEVEDRLTELGDHLRRRGGDKRHYSLEPQAQNASVGRAYSAA